MDFVKGDQDIPQVDTHWMSESGVIDIFLLLGPTPDAVFQQYATLTGTTPLPPVSSRLKGYVAKLFDVYIHCNGIALW